MTDQASVASSSPPNTVARFVKFGVFHGRFPEGLRVLVVDEDPHYLLTMENQLREFKYQVTKCNGLAAALSFLRGSKNSCDIVIVDVQDLNAERSKIFSQIRSETDIPVIIMSSDDSVESVIEGVRNGACDYLVKPIRPEVLRTIYKHVAKKVLERAEEEEKGETSSSCFTNPRKKVLDEEHDSDHVHGRVSKKRRVIWSTDLHRQFLDAVNQLGVDKAVPKKILEIMNDERLRRENVASHLQKYRMYLKRQEEEKENMRRSLSCPPDRNYYPAPPCLSGNTSTMMHQNPTRLIYPQQMQYPTSAVASPYPTPRPDRVPHLNDGLNPQRAVSAYPQISMMNHHHVVTHAPPPPLGQPALFDDGVSVAVPGVQNIGNGSSNLMGDNEADSEMMDSFFQGNPIDWNLDDIGLDPMIEPVLPISHDDLSSLLHNPEPCTENASQYFDPRPPSTSSSSDQMIPKSEFQGANQQENINGGFNVNGHYTKK